LKKNLIIGSVLDYGCGRGDDARALASAGFSVESFDPYWKPHFDTEKKYDTIYCNYVLNVLKEEDRNIVIEDVLSRLKLGGFSYFSVRRDSFAEGWSSRGYQSWVSLGFEPAFEKRGAFAIYKVGLDFI
jgi:2-polyprenyl-3-methyl-5-hydroxy-6-metoxy-1,4-benzoquinol methylase